MNLSTHRATQQDAHSRASLWSIGLIIIVSAVLAVLIEPLYPNPVLAAHRDASPAAATTRVDKEPVAPAAIVHKIRAAASGNNQI